MAMRRPFRRFFSAFSRGVLYYCGSKYSYLETHISAPSVTYVLEVVRNRWTGQFLALTPTVNSCDAEPVWVDRRRVAALFGYLDISTTTVRRGIAYCNNIWLHP